MDLTAAARKLQTLRSSMTGEEHELERDVRRAEALVGRGLAG